MIQVSLAMVCVGIALVCFVCAAFGVASRVNLLALGLAFWLLSGVIRP